MRWLPTEARFKESYTENENGCWVWSKSKDGRGYGMFQAEKINWKAHRYSYAFYIGPIPDGHFVCHKCDNPSCVNPDHLFIATHKLNMKDMVSKGRHSFGSKQVNSKLNELDVARIIILCEKGYTHIEIAKKYGVHQSTISRIIRCDDWKHVPRKI